MYVLNYLNGINSLSGVPVKNACMQQNITYFSWTNDCLNFRHIKVEIGFAVIKQKSFWILNFHPFISTLQGNVQINKQQKKNDFKQKLPMLLNKKKTTHTHGGKSINDFHVFPPTIDPFVYKLTINSLSQVRLFVKRSNQ
jgi:hypothetical protein